MLRMRVRRMGIMGRAGSRVGFLSARARGITDGAGHFIRATDIIVGRSAADLLAADLKDAVLADVELWGMVRSEAFMVDRYAVVRFMAEAGSTGAADPEADAGNGSLN